MGKICHNETKTKIDVVGAVHLYPWLVVFVLYAVNEYFGAYLQKPNIKRIYLDVIYCYAYS